MNPSYAIIYIIDAHQFSSLFTTGKRRISAHNRAIGRSGVPQEAQDDALFDGISADRQMPLLRPHRRPCCHGDSIPLMDDILVDALLKMGIVANEEFGWEIELLVITDSCIV